MPDNSLSTRPPLRIGILGNGNIARSLGTRWAMHGHTITFGGRSVLNTRAIAAEVGLGTTSASLVGAVRDVDVVVVAVPWTAVEDVLLAVDAAAGGLDGTTVLDPTNPVEHAVGRHLLAVGSASEHIASRSPGAHVVKAFNVHPAAYWDNASPEDTIAIAGDDPVALGVSRRLVRDVGATPHVLGGLERARQLEELAGTVIALVFGGTDPRSAVPAAADLSSVNG
ncbi:MAG: NAD(P)-binding domain-containing protein [Rhodococcus sp. (in: high G+C Gram-positive bacteria)]